MLSKHSLITSVLICVVVGERNAQHLGELSGVVNYSSDHQDCPPPKFMYLNGLPWGMASLEDVALFKIV